jgi:hypothetical protein
MRFPAFRQGEDSMRRATAILCRQALFAALASAFLGVALSALPGAARTQNAAGVAAEPLILVRSVALDHVKTISEAKAPVDVPARELTKAAAVARAPSPVARRACLVPPCQRLAALAPAPPHRPAERFEATPTRVAFETAAPQEGKGARSFPERLLQPVGNLRDRVMGLISSL